ncbi:MAG: YlxR family protein [Acidimicrobiales bacterium]
MRTCIGCRTKTEVGALVRIVIDGETLAVGPGVGRGAWLCAGRRDCLEWAAERDAFSRAFRAPVGREAVEALGSALFPAAPSGQAIV